MPESYGTGRRRCLSCHPAVTVESTVSRRSVAVCSEPGCPQLTDRGRCEPHRLQHQRTKNRGAPTRQARGLDATYQRLRTQVLAEEADCWVCGMRVDQALPGIHPEGPTVDHITRRVDGGTNERSNLRLAHNRCNSGRR
jgi:hypothetical protein